MSGIDDGTHKSLSSMFRGNLVEKSSLRIERRGPCDSLVRISRKHSWYQIILRTCVSMGPRPYSSGSRWNPIHSAKRMAVPTSTECARDTSARHIGIYKKKNQQSTKISDGQCRNIKIKKWQTKSYHIHHQSLERLGFGCFQKVRFSQSHFCC